VVGVFCGKEVPVATVATAGSLEPLIPHARWWRIIPPAILVYLIAYMDRMNIGFAMAGGMNEALKMSAATSGLAAGIFFWGYLVLQLPGGHWAEHGSAKKFITWTILGWGGLSLLTGFVQNSWQLLVLRFLLGVAEGGVYPAVLVIIGNWFPQRELGRANALFLAGLPLSGALTGPISGWMVSHYSWRGLFFFEGIVSLALMAIWLPLITERPESAQWLSQEEKKYLLTTLAAEKAARDASRKAAGQAKWSYAELLRDKNLWIMTMIWFCQLVGVIGYLIWLPTLIKQLTKASLTNVGWLSGLPLAVGVLGVYWFGALSDSKGNRRIWVANALWSFGAFFALSMVFPKQIWLCYGFLVATGLVCKALQSPMWCMASIVFPPGVAGGARGIINGVGNLGGFVGPLMFGWFATKMGGVNYGVYSLAAILVLGGCITMLMPKITAGYKYQEQANAVGQSRT
jgi:MFS family permease